MKKKTMHDACKHMHMHCHIVIYSLDSPYQSKVFGGGGHFTLEPKRSSAPPSEANCPSQSKFPPSWGGHFTPE